MPKYHHQSEYGPGPRVKLCREQRSQFRTKLKMQRRPGRITGAARDVGEALIDMLGQDGRLDPSHATLAKRAGVKLTACRDALKRLAACGFLTWVRRLIRGPATGGRPKQTSNAYVLLVPRCEAVLRQQVSVPRLKQVAQEQGGGWEAQVANAARQIAALGMRASGETNLLEARVRHHLAAQAAALAARR